jgi:hypothetical protein
MSTLVGSGGVGVGNGVSVALGLGRRLAGAVGVGSGACDDSPDGRFVATEAIGERVAPAV